MNEQLRVALEAVKEGREDEARHLLAEYLRDDPENVPAWVLMSKLATSEVQKVAFLRKILSLDPEHSYAREQLAASGAAQPQIPQSGEEAPPPIVEVDQAQETVPAGESVEEAVDVEEEDELPMAEAEEMGEKEPPTGEGWDLFPEEEGELPPAAEAPTVEPPPMIHTDDAIEAPEVLGGQEGEEDTTEGQEFPSPPAEVEEVGEDRGEIDWNRFLREEAGVELSAEEAEAELTMPLSEDPFDYEAQAEGDTIPPWMDEDETLTDEAFPPQAGERLEEEEPDQEIPDLVQEAPDESWLAEPGKEEEAAAAETEARIAEAMATSPTGQVPDGETNNLLVGVLVVLALLVFLALVYAAIVLL